MEPIKSILDTTTASGGLFYIPPHNLERCDKEHKQALIKETTFVIQGACAVATMAARSENPDFFLELLADTKKVALMAFAPPEREGPVDAPELYFSCSCGEFRWRLPKEFANSNPQKQQASQLAVDIVHQATTLLEVAVTDVNNIGQLNDAFTNLTKISTPLRTFLSLIGNMAELTDLFKGDWHK